MMPTKMTKTIPHMIEAKLVIPEKSFDFFFTQNKILVFGVRRKNIERKKMGLTIRRALNVCILHVPKVVCLVIMFRIL